MWEHYGRFETHSVKIKIHPGHRWASTFIQDISEHQHTSRTSVIIDKHPGHQWTSTYIQDIGIHSGHWWASTYIQDICEQPVHQWTFRSLVSIDIHPSHRWALTYIYTSRALVSNQYINEHPVHWRALKNIKVINEHWHTPMASAEIQVIASQFYLKLCTISRILKNFKSNFDHCALTLNCKKKQLIYCLFNPLKLVSWF